MFYFTTEEKIVWYFILILSIYTKNVNKQEYQQFDENNLSAFSNNLIFLLNIFFFISIKFIERHFFIIFIIDFRSS